MGWYKVTDTIHHTDEVVIHLTIDGEELETTPEHPFYVEDEGWVDAEDLQVGDDIRNADGEIGEVEAIESEQISQEMYNLTVDEAHTFFVGDGQWLVHNTIWCDNYEEYYDVARDLNYQVHHILPRRFESVFENTNIDIHDARWLREVQSNPALGNYHQYFYTNKWQAWADNLGRTPTPSEVVNYARTLEKKYLQEYGTAFYRAGSNMPGLVDWKTLIRLLR